MSARIDSLIKSTPEDELPWTQIIGPAGHWWDLQLQEVWRYRDLLWMFVKRDFVAVYKQTVLGPIWFFIQPLLTTLVFTIIFSGVAGMSTNGLPPLLFYLAGTIPWNYFSTCLTKTSTTFVSNAAIFGKVYFPRLIVPLSVVVSNLIQFAIQFLLFAAVFLWYLATTDLLKPNWGAVLLVTPALLILMAALGLGTGIIVSSLTTKYRDMTFLVAFGIQLAMYGTPVIYPLSAIPQQYSWLIRLNPMTAPIESFRAAFLGGPIPWMDLGLSAVITLALLLFGVILFNKVEKTFMDTV